MLSKIDLPNEQFRNFLFPLLGDKDHEKILEIVAKVEKTNHHVHGKQGRATAIAPYSALCCNYCGLPGHVKVNCFKPKWDIGESLRVFPGRCKQAQNSRQCCVSEIFFFCIFNTCFEVL